MTHLPNPDDLKDLVSVALLFVVERVLENSSSALRAMESTNETTIFDFLLSFIDSNTRLPVIVSRQAVKTLAPLFSGTLLTKRAIDAIREHSIIEKCVSMVKTGDGGTEFALITVQLLWRLCVASSDNSTFTATFKSSGGYDALLNVSCLSEDFDGNDKENVLEYLSLLVHVGQDQTFDGHLNTDGLWVLVSAFTKQKDKEFRGEVKKVLMDALQRSTADEREDILTNLFGKEEFSGLDSDVKNEVIEIIRTVHLVEDFSESELSTFCALLPDCEKEPEIAGHISDTLDEAMARGATELKERLNGAGLYNAVVICLTTILSELQSNEIKQDASLNLYAKLVHLTKTYITENPVPLERLRGSTALRTVEGFVHYSKARNDTLGLLTVIGSVEPHKTETQPAKDKVIQDLVSILQSTGGTSADDPAVFALWADVLCALATLMNTRKSAALAFRAAGGFTWVISVVNGVGQSETAASTAGKLFYSVLRCLRSALSGCPENVAYVRSDLTFETLSDVFKICVCLCGDVQSGVDELLSTATNDCWIEIPEIVEIILVDLLDSIRTVDGEAQLKVLSEVHRLLSLSHINTEAVCRDAIQVHIVSHYGQELIADEPTPAASLLTDILCDLCAYNTTTRVTKKLFTLASKAEFCDSALNFLRKVIPAKEVIPVSFLRLSNAAGHVSGLCSLKPSLWNYLLLANTMYWPPQQFSMSMWLCPEIMSDGNCTVPIISISCNNETAPSIIASLVDGGKLKFRVAPRSQKGSNLETVFTKFTFTAGEWHHVVVTYIAKREKAFGLAPCVVSLYVDGVLSEEAEIELDVERLATPFITLGCPPQTEGDTGQWTICTSNIYTFREHTSKLEAFMLYMLGPTFNGNLGGSFTYYARSLGNFYCRHNKDSAVCSLALQALSMLEQDSLSALWENTMYVILAANASIVNIEHGSSESPLEAIPTSGSITYCVHKRRTMREAVAATGGISLCLYMLGVAETAAQQQGCLRLLTTLLDSCPVNMYDMRRLRGYELIARFMQKPRWVLDKGALEAAFDLVRVQIPGEGVEKSFSGAIVDTDALRLILLDWRIWSRAEEPLKIALFDGLLSLFTEFPEFNAKRAFACGAVTELLHIIESPNVGLALAQSIVDVLRCIIDPKGSQENTLEGAKEIALFLLATHKTESNVRHTLHTPRIKRFQRSSLALSAAMSVSKSENTNSEDLGNSNSSSSGTPVKVHRSQSLRMRSSASGLKLSSRKNEVDILLTRKRVLLFDMLSGVLEDRGLPEKFFSQVLPLTNVMYMLQTPDPEVRLCLLKLLSFFINTQKASGGVNRIGGISSSGGAAVLRGLIHSSQVKKAASYIPFKELTSTNFTLSGGFDFLGIQLQSYSLTPGLLHVLFRLMIGSAFPSESTTDVFVTLRGVLAEKPHRRKNTTNKEDDRNSGGASSNNNKEEEEKEEEEEEEEDIELEHPEMARTILQVAASQLARYKEQYSVIKAFHIICSTSQRTLSQLLDHNLLYGIFGILLARTSQRRDGSSAPVEDENDEDVMALVRAIILGSAGGKSCAKTMNEALLLVNSMGFTQSEERRLQARIAGDVVRFYEENPLFYCSSEVVGSLVQVSSTIMNYVWRAKCIVNEKEDEGKSGEYGYDGEDDDNDDYLLIDGTSMDVVVVGLLRLLEGVLRAVGTPKYRDTVGRHLSTVMDTTWHMLLYIFKLPGQPTEVLNAGLRAICSKPVLAYPDLARCTAILVYISKLCGKQDIGPSARTAYDLLRSVCLSQGKSGVGSEVSSSLTPINMLRGNAGRAQSTALQYFGVKTMVNKIPQGLIEDAIEWDAHECAAEQRFVTEQTAALERMRADIEHFYASVQSKRLAMSDKVGSAQLRAQTALYAAQADRYQREAAAAHTAWKEVFRNATSENSPCAFALHAPFHRLAIDPTYDRLGQRLRLKWKISDPDAPTLEPPYAIPKLSCGRSDGIIAHTYASNVSYVYAFDKKDVSDAEDKTPYLVGIDPPLEVDRHGGRRVTLHGTNLSGDMNVSVGGRPAELVEVNESRTEAVIITPQQDSWGFYEVDAVHNNCVNHSKHIKYGYIEVCEYRRYMEAKYCVPLDPSLVYVCGKDEPSAGLRQVASRSLKDISSDSTSSAKEGPKGPQKTLGVRGFKATTTRITQDDKVHFANRATRISAYSELEGEVVLSDKKISFFIDSTKQQQQQQHHFSQGKAQSWNYSDVYEMLKRRYVLRDVGVEIFFTTGKAAFFAFPDTPTRDLFMKNIQSVPHKRQRISASSSSGRNGSSSSSSVEGVSSNRSTNAYSDGDAAEDITSNSTSTKKYTDSWVRGEMSNYEYLMRLNMLSGRTYNDLNQYPVFPFILADYTSEKLDLTNPKTFRDLSKPMGAQSPSRVEKAVIRYEQLADMGEIPYHYGTHYSSSGAVLHYMSRLEPYASYHVAFQSGHFDVPDRLFFDLAATWNLTSNSPLGDGKELIPEFFCLPEMFENRNNFDFGERQDGTRVYGVRLPPWAHNDPREFVRIHRAALECEYVSAHLHEWIDLIFGCKQQSKEALNVFHPYTCEGGIDWDAIKDPVDRLAKQTQVNTWGQIPRKLFRKPHPVRNMKLVCRHLKAPSFADPNTKIKFSVATHISGPVAFLGVATADGTLIADGPCKAHVLTGSHSQCLSWGNWDGTICVRTDDARSLSQSQQQQQQSQQQKRDFKVNNSVTVASLSRSGHCFACGTDSGVILVWRRHSSSKPILSGKFTKLYAHDHPITVNIKKHIKIYLIFSAGDRGQQRPQHSGNGVRRWLVCCVGH